MKKERIFYLDFIRAIATIIVVIYHFNCHFTTYNITGFNDIFYKHANGDWGNIGVTLFFIISGVALMYNYSEKIKYKDYSIKRFKSIYPMFWIAYTIATLYYFYYEKSIIQIPKERFLLTLVGMDGYFLYAIPNFYRLGEWFLGAIIFIYILFPICRYLIKKNRKIATISIIVLGICKYILMIYYPFNIAATRNIIVCIFSFILGMYFIEYIKNVKLYQAIIALILFVVILVIKIPIPVRIIATIPGTLLFIVLVYISKFINNKIIRKPFEILGKYSYAIFLVHHVVILQVEKRFIGMTLGKVEVLCMFLITIIITFIIAKLLNNLTEYIVKKVEENIKLNKDYKKERINGKV